MARKITEVQAQIFSALSRLASVSSTASDGRFIATTEEERKWITNAKFKGEIRFDSVNRIIHVQFEKSNFVVLVNFAPPSTLPEGLRPIDLNAGLFSILAAEQNILNSRAESLEIIQYIFYEVTKEYQGHDFSDVNRFYAPVYAIQAIPGGYFDSSDVLTRVSLIFATECLELRTLSFSPKTLERCQEMALDNRSQVPTGLVAHALIAVKWEHCFLDLYRCVERLFSIPTMIQLKKSLGVTLTGVQISSIVEETTGWRKGEEEGLGALFKECDTTCQAFHAQFVRFDNSLATKYSSRVVAKHLYKLRNSIVHYRPATELPTLEEPAWSSIIEFLVELIVALYDTYQHELAMEAATAPASDRRHIDVLS